MTDMSGYSSTREYALGSYRRKNAEDCPSIHDNPRHRVRFGLTDRTDCAYVQHIGSRERKNRWPLT